MEVEGENREVLMIINRGCEVVAGIRENRYMSFL